MKKILNIISVVVCVVCMVFVISPITVRGADEEVLVVMQCNVDKEIGEKGREVKLTIFETTSYEEYEVMFYPTSNYRTKFTVPLGTYKIDSWYVSGTIDHFSCTAPDFTATGQTVNVDVKIGNGDWTGEVKDNTLNGTIDRDKTNEIREEQGKDPIDWEKTDKETADYVDGILTPAGEITVPTEPEPTTIAPTETPATEPTSVPSVATPDTEQNTKPDDKSGDSIIPTVIFIVVVIGGCLAIIVYKRKKQGLPLISLFHKDEE